jgi:opacity protein-like surface antigen
MPFPLVSSDVPSMDGINDAIADAISPFFLMAKGVHTGVADAAGTFTVNHGLGVVPVCMALIFGAAGSGAGSRKVHLQSVNSSTATFQITLTTTGAADANSTQDVHWICVGN